MDARPVVVRRVDAEEVVGPQGQALTPLITRATARATGMSAGFVRMPPGGVSLAHVHAHSEIVIAVLSGHAATVVWEDGEPHPLLHGPDEVCFVPPGVPHCAVNLSTMQPVSGLEFRTDPEFNADVVLRPELQDQATQLAVDLRGDSA